MDTSQVPSASSIAELSPASSSAAGAKDKEETTTTTQGPQVYQFRIDFENTKPPLWRRVLVPETMTLKEFHEVILCLFGLRGDRPHKFEFTGWYKPPETFDEELELQMALGTSRVNQKFALGGRGNKARYTYDLRKKLAHLVKLENILPPMKEGTQYPICTGGRRANIDDKMGTDGKDKFVASSVDFSKIGLFMGFEDWKR